MRFIERLYLLSDAYGGCRLWRSLRNGAALTEGVDFISSEAKFLQDLVVVFSDFRSAFGGHFSDIVYLDGTADCELQIPSGALDRHDDSIRLKLGIFGDFARSVNDTKCKVTLFEDFLPVRYRL